MAEGEYLNFLLQQFGIYSEIWTVTNVSCWRRWKETLLSLQSRSFYIANFLLEESMYWTVRLTGIELDTRHVIKRSTLHSWHEHDRLESIRRIMLGQYIVYNNQIFYLDNHSFPWKRVFVPGQWKISVETGQNSNLYFFLFHV